MGKQNTLQGKELRGDKKSGVLDFKLAQEKAQKFTEVHIKTALDRIDKSLVDGQWSIAEAQKPVGQEMALAYATGYLDALLSKTPSRIIT